MFPSRGAFQAAGRAPLGAFAPRELSDRHWPSLPLAVTAALAAPPSRRGRQRRSVDLSRRRSQPPSRRRLRRRARRRCVQIPTRPSARSGECPHPATPNDQPRPNPHPGPVTATPTPAPPPTPKPRPPKPNATTPSPAETPGTNGDTGGKDTQYINDSTLIVQRNALTVGNTSNPSTQQNTQDTLANIKSTQEAPNTGQRPHPRHPPTRTQSRHRQHPHHRKHQHHQQSCQYNTLTITITGGAAVLTSAYDTYAHQHQVQHLHHQSQRHQQHHRQNHPAISVATGNLWHQRQPTPPQPVKQQTTKPRPEETRAHARNHQQQHRRHQSNACNTLTNGITSSPHHLHLLHTLPVRANGTSPRPPGNKRSPPPNTSH